MQTNKNLSSDIKSLIGFIVFIAIFGFAVILFSNYINTPVSDSATATVVAIDTNKNGLVVIIDENGTVTEHGMPASDRLAVTPGDTITYHYIRNGNIALAD